MKRSVVQTIIEAATYLSLGYLTLPAHEQQRLRLTTLRAVEQVGWFVASRAGNLAIKAEARYNEEVGV